MATGNQSTTEAFVRYQESVASNLRYVQAQENLAQLHDLGRPIRVLDAAGGNGLNTEFLLRHDHTVTLLDSDPEMLKEARERLGAAGLLERCQLVEGTLEAVAERVPHDGFDLILCHHVLEYTDSSPQILRSFAEVATASGEISLITINPVSEAIRAVVFRQEAALARSKLTDLAYDAKWFGQASLYTFDQIVAWAEEAGWSLGDFRAIRCWPTTSRRSGPSRRSRSWSTSRESSPASIPTGASVDTSSSASSRRQRGRQARCCRSHPCLRA